MKRKLIFLTIFLSLLIIIIECFKWHRWGRRLFNTDWVVFLTDKRIMGLHWNLFLAWLSVVFAFAFQKNDHKVISKILLILWFLWLPNTLYMITDLKYFRVDYASPLWQELLFFGAFGTLGGLLYLLAVLLVSEKLRFNRNYWIGITLYAIMGVMAGRLFRWNSWDVFLSPGKILTSFLDLF